MLKTTLIVLALSSSAATAQVVIPAQCPEGFYHEGSYCIGEENGRRYSFPYADFLRGGRFFGMHGFRGGRPIVIHRPPVHRPPVVVRPGIGHRPGVGHPVPTRPHGDGRR